MSSIEAIFKFLKINVADSAVAKLHQYCELVISGNTRVNVTGARTVDDFIAGPLFDALTLIPLLCPHSTIVDIGSGGGLPAVPLTILFPDINLTLVEPRTRRAAFLKQVQQMLFLTNEIRCTQDRELSARQWDAAISQAVFPPPLWMKRARRLVRPGGCIYVLSSSAVAPDQLPSGCHIELQQDWKRPMDGATRFSTRIRIV
jgi:16S rRNA (guanine527-N7)-methyltransferase